MYRAPPVRRVHIPKGDGSQTRPIGIPTFGDKVLQRAVAMLLGAVYEQDFLECSYGFRPGRSAHDALDAVRDGLLSMRGAWVLEVDLRKFFDTLGGPERTPVGERDEKAPRSFDFLGFTVFWGRTFSGRPTVRTQTRVESLTKSLGAIRVYCRRHLHDPLVEQHRSLS